MHWMFVLQHPRPPHTTFLCCSPNSQRGCTWRWTFLEVIKVKWGIEVLKVGPWPCRISALIRGDTREISISPSVSLRLSPLILSTVWKHSKKLSSQERSSHQETNWPETWSWTSSLQNCEKINFCCLHHLVNDILLGQPEPSNIVTVFVLQAN